MRGLERRAGEMAVLVEILCGQVGRQERALRALQAALGSGSRGEGRDETGDWKPESGGQGEGTAELGPESLE